MAEKFGASWGRLVNGGKNLLSDVIVAPTKAAAEASFTKAEKMGSNTVGQFTSLQSLINL